MDAATGRATLGLPWVTLVRGSFGRGIPRENTTSYWAHWPWLAGMFGAGLIFRFFIAAFGGPLSNDAAAFYLPNARALVEGGLDNWQGMTIAVPPLFPTLVALLFRWVGDLELSALIISMVAGAAMVFPALGFARLLTPGHVLVQRFTMVIAAAHPFSVRFGGDAKGDALYALLFACALWTGLEIRRSPTLGRGFVFGVFVGLAYLVRPEALGLALLLALAVVIGGISRCRRGEGGGYFARALIAGCLALLALAPSLAWNLVFVHEKIGIWTLSPKAGVLQDYQKEGQGDVLGALNEDLSMTMHEEKLSDPSSYRSFSPLQLFLADPANMLRSYGHNLYEYVRLFPPGLGTLPCVLLVIGALFSWRRARRAELWCVCGVLVFYGLSFTLFYVSRRFWLALVPAVLPLTGAGGVLLATALRRRWGISMRWTLILFVLCMLPEGGYRVLRRGNGWFTSPEKELARKIVDQYGTGHLFVSPKGRVALYAGGKNLNLPSNALDDILVYLTKRGVSFVIADERWMERRRPGLWREVRASRRLEEACSLGSEGSRLIAYRVVPTSEDAPPDGSEGPSGRDTKH